MCSGFLCVCVYQGYGSVCGIDDVDLGPPMSMSGAQICHSPCHPVYFFSLALCCLILCALRDDMHIMLIWFWKLWKPEDWSFLSSAFWQLPFGRIMKTEIVCLEEQHNHDGWLANSWQISNFCLHHQVLSTTNIDISLEIKTIWL
jgi:hypothetical protein